MALGLFKLSNGQGQISSDGSFNNPILWEASINGGVLEARYYLKMENANVEYLTSGTLYAVDAAGPDESSWFSFAPDEAGGPGEYSDTFEFELPLGSEMPVWIRVEIPSGIENEPKDDVLVTASYILHTEE